MKSEIEKEKKAREKIREKTSPVPGPALIWLVELEAGSRSCRCHPTGSVVLLFKPPVFLPLGSLVCF